MTASTPPLVDVIAEAIAAHERLISQSLHQECGCGWVGKVLGFDHAAHQARVVLDVAAPFIAAETQRRAGKVFTALAKAEAEGHTYTIAQIQDHITEAIS